MQRLFDWTQMSLLQTGQIVRVQQKNVRDQVL